MPVNPGIEYKKAEREFTEANTVEDKIKALQNMLRTAPSHKGSEVLRANIKTRLAKYRALMEKEQKQKKGKASKYSIKKEGAAQVVIVGTPNSGKSTLLTKLTNAKPEIKPYPFTTKEPEIGVMDYDGVKVQLIEIPAFTKNFVEREHGTAFLGIIRQADLIVILYNNDKEKQLILNELKVYSINKKIIDGTSRDIKEKIWSKLWLIKVYTKQPGKERDFPPVALKEGSRIEDLAEKVHKDFIKNFKFARVWGKSVKFDGMQVSLNHILADNDIVEFHLK